MDNNDREKLEIAAAAAYQLKVEEQARFRAYGCTHYGLAPGTTSDEIEEIVRLRDEPKLLPWPLLLLCSQFKLGLPAGYLFSVDQIYVTMKEMGLTRNR